MTLAFTIQELSEDGRFFLVLTSNPNICSVLYVISVNAGLVSTWRMMGRRVWMLTNAPLPFLVASAASTLTALTNACVWMATKHWTETPIHARLWQVSLFHLYTCIIPVRYCKSHRFSNTTCSSFQLKSLFSLWRTTMRSGSWAWMAQITLSWNR